MRRCREATIEDPKAKHYINILLSSVEYETFVKLMRIMKPVAAQHRNSSGKVPPAEKKKDLMEEDDEKPPSQQPSSPSKLSKLDADALNDEKREDDHHQIAPAEAKISSMSSAADKDGK